MRDFYVIYVSAFVEAFVESVVVALVLGALCWLVELLVGRRIGSYAGYVAMFAVALVILRFAYIDFIECSGVFGPSLCELHGWHIMIRSFYASLALITIPLLILSEIKLRRWSLNRALPTH
jgi:NhaP-type Na+/H+ and K+/H+ antiporter